MSINRNLFGKTFKAGELKTALNVTFSPLETPTQKEKGENAGHKIDSRMDPSRVKGNDYNKQLMEDWLAKKDHQTKQKIKDQLKQQKMKESQKAEEEKQKRILEKKNFSEWERKKKDLLENKIRKSQELKLRKQAERKEIEEKKRFNEKAFEKWKTKKSEQFKKEHKEKYRSKKEKEQIDLQQKIEKERNQKKVFERWCERQQELEARKREALKVAQEADHELSVILQLRDDEADIEYERWKRDKEQQNRSHKQFAPTAAWYPPGINPDRNDVVITTSTPGKPLSKTLTQVKDMPIFHRRLRTIQACCRPITYWCHCSVSGPNTCRSSPPNTTELFSSFSSTQPTHSPVNDSIRGSGFHFYGTDDHYSLDRSYDATMGSRSPYSGVRKRGSANGSQSHSRASTPR